MFRTKPGEERALIEDWINRPALRKLVEACGGTWSTSDLETVVNNLVDFSEVWDYRAGAHSRLMFHDDQDGGAHEHLTYEAAEELGLMNPKPPSADHYDYLLILGGLATGVEPRVKYAADLLKQGLTVRHQVAGLGSYRELQPKELPVSRYYAPQGRYEIDHLAAMMAALFGGEVSPPDLDAEAPTQATAWEVAPSTAMGPAFAAYSAVGREPDRRPANTAETYDMFLARAHVEPGQTILLATSTIYVPYQHLDAVRVLGTHQLEVETVGAVVDEPSRHSARAYRQEIRSFLRSAALILQC